MDTHNTQPVTRLLRQASLGDQDARDDLAPLVIEELHRIAARSLRRERDGHTLQPTLLADEAFVRLVGAQPIEWQDRSHFYGVAARAIRQILVDHARSKRRLKRGGDAVRVDFASAEPASEPSKLIDLLALDEAMTKLSQLDEQQARIVELKYFGGLTSQQIAAVLDVSVRTVDGDWAMARAWLRTQLIAPNRTG